MKLLVPILAIVVGVLVVIAVARSGRDAPPIPEASAPVVTAESTEEAEATATPEPTDAPADPAGSATDPTDDAALAADESATADVAQLHGLKALSATQPLAPSLGSDDPASGHKLKIDFTSYGAGIRRVTLADYNQFVDPPSSEHPRVPYRLIDVMHGLDGDQAPQFYPYAARRLQIGDAWVGLDNVAWQAGPLVKSDGAESVTYTVKIEDGDGQPIAEVRRTWTVQSGSYDVRLDQQIKNLTDTPLEMSLDQFGQGDVLIDLGAYLGDRRMFVTGHFRAENPPKYSIYVDDSYIQRRDLVKGKRTLWPNPDLKPSARLAWLAVENRYFAMVTHAPVPADATTTAEVPELDSAFSQIGYSKFSQDVDPAKADPELIALTLQSKPTTVAPGQATEVNLAVYAGPRQKQLLTEAPYNLLHLDKLVRYELGCTFCTFQWLAKTLLGYLKGLHWVVKDWGIAIIILVLTVRVMLHPITKRAQTNMMKMSKQMGRMQPEVAKLKEKYKDDPTALNREMMKLYREAGVNPANMLGCLPMLLQSPIWIALYATLYFAIELRHEPAFYGIFQMISGGNWHFLQDLSVSDNFIRFIPPDQPAYKITWLPLVKPEFRSLNILPILMAVVFFFQMKLTTPPAQNEQQKQQQAIMKFMPFMFPVFLYSAPSGLTLYICCSTLAGIVDSYLVRKHVREQEEAGTLFEKKPVKPGGFRDRMQKRMEMAQQMAAQRQGDLQKKSSQGSKQYKKRK